MQRSFARLVISYAMGARSGSGALGDLMETLQTPGAVEMITMYHPDGDSILATHYCATGNQPRMRAASQTGDVGKLEFSYVDASNLANADAEVMRGLVVIFGDADHFQQRWTLRRRDGKEETGVFEYSRKK